jgi:4-amino-4-deoxy-L-arabinose transferase-like glycosyltransferase
MIYFKGVLLIVLVTAVFTAAYQAFKKNKIQKSLFLIILGGFILRGWCIWNDGFLFAWDERYHALVAKNLMSNPFVPVLFKNPLLDYDFRQWTLNHVWLHKQPLSLWFMAGSMKIFGTSEWALRLPSLLLSTIGIYLTFRIARFFKDKKTGLLAAFFQAINGLVIEIATGRESTEHPDNTFFFFIELAIWWIIVFLNRKTVLNLILIGFWIGLAILSKWLAALIVFPIFIFLTLDTEGVKKTAFNIIVISLTAIAIALPWQLYIFNQFPAEANWEYASNLKHFTEIIEGHDGSWAWHLSNAVSVWNELIFVAFGWFLLKTVKENKNKHWWSLMIWVSIPYFIFSIAATKMIAYPLFTAPAIFTILAMFWWHLFDNPLKIKWLNSLILTAIIILSIRYSYERMRLFRDSSLYSSKTETLKSWKLNNPTVVFNLPETYIETMFYTSVEAAYPFTPSEKQIELLKQKGYDIWIQKDSSLPVELLSRNDVHFIEK